MVSLQRNKYTVDGVYGQSNGQLTKCDLVLILRSPLRIRHHLNAEWEIWNSTVHKSDAVWYEYCQLHLSSLRSCRGEICCAAPALMNKINISCGKRFAGWTQGMQLACRVGTAEMLCSAWTILGNSQSTSQPASQPKQPSWSPWKICNGEGESLLNILLSFCTWGVLAVSFIFSWQAHW